MSKLRLSLLETIRIIGNASGCHQIPDRSFFYKGKQFPVCARCTGVCLGQITALLMPMCRIRIPFQVCISLLGLMGFDWILQESGFRQSTNPRRLLTGFAGGFGLFSLYLLIIRAITGKTQ